MKLSLGGGLLLGHAAPCSDELFSSWIVRLAAQNRMKLHSFCAMVWPGTSIWNRDIDSSASVELLERLSARTGIPPERVRKTTLQAYEGVLFERHNPNGNTPWVMPLGIYHRTRTRFGLQVCPDCLSQDRRYYRRSWRLACSVMCLDHIRPLLDRCDCGAPINFHRGDMGDRHSVRTEAGFVTCHKCNADIRKAMGPSYDLVLTSAALETQRSCYAAIDTGFASLAGADIPAPLFFAGFRQLLQLLARGRLSVDLRGVMSPWRSREDYHPSFPGRISAVEKLPVQDRAILMALAGEWLNKWPMGFVNSCKCVGVTASDICKDLHYVPYWLAKVVDEHFGSNTYSPAIAEIEEAIRYLRRSNIVPTKTAVSKLLGRTDVFRKRKLYSLLEPDTLPLSE